MTVTDACNHTASTVITVEVPDAFSIEENVYLHKDVTCPGGNDGKLVIGDISGGVAPYTYTIDAGSYSTDYVFSNLTAGNHVLTAKDANGCTANITVTITEPEPFDVAITTSPATCANNNGAVRVTVFGGTPSDITGYIFRYSGALTYNDLAYTNSVASMSPWCIAQERYHHGE